MAKCNICAEDVAAKDGNTKKENNDLNRQENRTFLRCNGNNVLAMYVQIGFNTSRIRKSSDLEPVVESKVLKLVSHQNTWSGTQP